MSNDPADNWREEIAALLVRGDKIGAIRVYREHTGADLATAKTFVEELHRSLQTGQLPEEPSSDLDARVVSELTANGKIAAIKLYREARRCGLKEAKEAVERIAEAHGIPQGRSGCAGVLLAVCVVIAICVMCW